MNRIHRIVWSQSRQAFIVAGENTKAKGKPSTTRTGIASAVVLALAAMACHPAMASPVPAQTWSAASGNNTGVFDNSGFINGTGIGGTSIGVLASSSFTGSMTNSGTISAVNNGILLSGLRRYYQ